MQTEVISMDRKLSSAKINCDYNVHHITIGIFTICYLSMLYTGEPSNTNLRYFIKATFIISSRGKGSSTVHLT